MTPADFAAAFPEFDSTPAPTVQRLIDASVPYFNVPNWGSLYADGLGNWIAHRIAMQNAATNSNASAGAGDATSKQVGTATIMRDGKNISAQMADPYLRTVYGQEYRRLSKLVGTRAVPPARGCLPFLRGFL